MVGHHGLDVNLVGAVASIAHWQLGQLPSNQYVSGAMNNVGLLRHSDFGSQCCPLVALHTQSMAPVFKLCCAKLLLGQNDTSMVVDCGGCVGCVVVLLLAIVLVLATSFTPLRVQK